ncbi:MAG: branched-chain amino acid ABC transporter substrate-binding protein [Deltaproteobacteria bacterium]|nr:branched-chain amino acid ABC transporter substrate-binding protein [Deltaproteobacteria bacterium]
MKCISKGVVFFACVLSILFLTAFNSPTASAAKAEKKAKAVKAEPAEKVKFNAAVDASKMGDMSDYDPSNPVVPTGDTIKIAIVASFSGAAAANGQFYWNVVQWVAHDINKRGGLLVDGKKKLIEVLKADHMGKADQCKKVTERMILQEKVNFLWGTDGSHLMKIINETANKYKVIALNATCLSDDLQDANNFSRYAFHAAFSTEQVGRAFAYYYGQVRKKEKKFYILCQDYSFGHQIADGFKAGLKEYYPEAQIVGEDYHKLFLTDFAPYLEKIKASGAEVVYTGDWFPDAGNVLKQARQMGVKLPFANIYMDTPDFLHEVGVEGTKGLTNLSTWFTANPQFKEPGYIKMYQTWNGLWKNKWKTPPFNGRTFEIYGGNWGSWTNVTYWLMSVVERAKTTDPEKIISIWENDTFKFVNGKVVKMRACDHKIVQDLAIIEFVPWEQQKVSYNIPPYYWYKGCSSYGPSALIPAAKVLPWMDQKLDRCKGKTNWGE